MMKTIIYTFSFLVLVTSCGNQGNDPAVDTEDRIEQIGKDLSGDVKSEWQEIQSSLEDYQVKINAKIKELDAQIDVANAEAKEELEGQKNGFQKWSNKMKAKMSLAQEEIAKDWTNLKRETTAYLEQIQEALDGDS